MGNDNSKTFKPRFEQEEQIQIPHQKFANFREVLDEELLEISMEIPQEKDVKSWEYQLMSTLNGFESKDGLLLPVKYEYQGKGFCGSVGLIKLFFENYPYLFSEQLQNRKTMEKHFDEEQLWYLLYSLVSAARDFAKLNLKIGDVRPDNIFINEQGHVKVANIFSWPYQRNNFAKTVYQKQITYLSPEQMNIIEKGSFDNNTNLELSESFSIGLTLLEAGLLFKAKSLYTAKDTRFEMRELEAALHEWANMQFRDDSNQEWLAYSPLLKALVSKMCHPDPNQRLSSVKVQQLLRPYGDEILNLRDFDKKHIVLQEQKHAGHIRHNEIQHIMPQQVRTRVVEEKTHPEHGRQAQLVHSTYTYEPMRREQPLHQVPQQVYHYNYQPVPNNQQFNPPNRQSSPVKPQVNRPVSYNPPIRETSPLKTNSTTIAYPQQVVHNPNIITHPHLNYGPRNTTNIPQNPSTVPQHVFNPPQPAYRQVTYQQPVATHSHSHQPLQSISFNTYNHPQSVSVNTNNPGNWNNYASAPYNESKAPSSSVPNDLLRKIDMQLQQSRQQFPS